MGTQYHIRLPVTSSINDAPRWKQLQYDIDALLLAINKEMSPYIEDSSISRFNQAKNTNWFPISREFLSVINTAQSVSLDSQGAFDITVMPLVNLWGFGTLNKTSIPSQQQIEYSLNQIGYQSLQTRQQPAAIRKQKPELSIDLSAIAKGYAVDAIGILLEKRGIKRYLVEIGGEIRVRGKNKQNQAWRIAIEKPTTLARSVQQGVLLKDGAIATSGDYRNYYEKEGKRYSHTINPKTGYPITHKLASVTVLNKSAMVADAQATAIMVLGEKQGKVYALQQGLMVYMIIRSEKGFSVWHNLHHDILMP
ncbi:MAG TPA: FAD:protein FMN transferase [Leucothrix mucor]|uniref:FAD:protein FMN transferase n=1 Tax=Leucothrix mucor TaxID=45248 RepID=A0A7V2WVU5_LEUMU|nr:FAD:protein FMN transferase [Leucothrix mucor]